MTIEMKEICVGGHSLQGIKFIYLTEQIMSRQSFVVYSVCFTL